jgi:Flp pilus assembly pilin Flp
MPKFLTDRRAVTSLEYALVAAAIGIVLLNVLQVPAESLASVIASVLAGSSDGGAAAARH